ncbi:MAG: 2-amino-4-hydroxy-6-hydroxymethyldihydropteridine diphosphokinase [Defluviitaleaceae bacterium]|nr:2-amino-4-hydroxy-6-hydroxymethyldihydropteridine diphosphokinase [Defluviitaleaceae bacterium]
MNGYSDKICIDGLEIFSNHGVLEAEKVLGQKFVVCAELSLDLRRAGVTDDVAQTVSYAEVCADITGIVAGETYDLIETCAERVAGCVLGKYAPVREITVVVEKPWAPIGQGVRNLSVRITRRRVRAYLGLGANMGEPRAMLDAAIAGMAAENLRVLRCSAYYTTKPVSDIAQDDYQNCVVEIETTLSPRELMSHLLGVEAALGRERHERWGPRVIDIDVLTYDDLVTEDAFITLPHPHLHERMFVLEPLCELNPHAVHPLLRRRMSQLKSDLEGTP